MKMSEAAYKQLSAVAKKQRWSITTALDVACDALHAEVMKGKGYHG